MPQAPLNTTAQQPWASAPPRRPGSFPHCIRPVSQCRTLHPGLGYFGAQVSVLWQSSPDTSSCWQLTKRVLTPGGDSHGALHPLAMGHRGPPRQRVRPGPHPNSRALVPDAVRQQPLDSLSKSCLLEGHLSVPGFPLSVLYVVSCLILPAILKVNYYKFAPLTQTHRTKSVSEFWIFNFERYAALTTSVQRYIRDSTERRPEKGLKAHRLEMK